MIKVRYFFFKVFFFFSSWYNAILQDLLGTISTFRLKAKVIGIKYMRRVGHYCCNLETLQWRVGLGQWFCTYQSSPLDCTDMPHSFQAQVAFDMIRGYYVNETKHCAAEAMGRVKHNLGTGVLPAWLHTTSLLLPLAGYFQHTLNPVFLK